MTFPTQESFAARIILFSKDFSFSLKNIPQLKSPLCLLLSLVDKTIEMLMALMMIMMLPFVKIMKAQFMMIMSPKNVNIMNILSQVSQSDGSYPRRYATTS